MKWKGYSKQPIPGWTRGLTENEFDKWLEKSGQFISDGIPDHAADKMARFQIEDDRMKDKKDDDRI
ncbi:MAG: hypothetical protein LAT56_00230 [Wenzhouxiangella sp.]|nr:hypothetical protein [Wenzhouxiangella sp.]